MRLQLERKTYTDTSTIGELSIDGKFFCYTLEDAVRAPGVKIPGRTAIPSGAYEVKLTWSPRFQKVMPLVDGVVNYSGVRIHPGNTDKDTEGCILVGKTKSDNFIGESRDAFADLFPILDEACKDCQTITLVIHDNHPEAVAAAPVAKATKKA